MGSMPNSHFPQFWEQIQNYYTGHYYMQQIGYYAEWIAEQNFSEINNFGVLSTYRSSLSYNACWKVSWASP
jgi:hypothetical protein